MKIVYKLCDMIHNLPFIKKGRFNKDIGTFILIGGSSYKCSDFDKYKIDKYKMDKYKIDKEALYYNNDLTIKNNA